MLPNFLRAVGLLVVSLWAGNVLALDQYGVEQELSRLSIGPDEIYGDPISPEEWSSLVSIISSDEQVAGATALDLRVVDEVLPRWWLANENPTEIRDSLVADISTKQTISAPVAIDLILSTLPALQNEGMCQGDMYNDAGEGMVCSMKAPHPEHSFYAEYQSPFDNTYKTVPSLTPGTWLSSALDLTSGCRTTAGGSSRTVDNTAPATKDITQPCIDLKYDLGHIVRVKCNLVGSCDIWGELWGIAGA